jgi:hypothetical protein
MFEFVRIGALELFDLQVFSSRAKAPIVSGRLPQAEARCDPAVAEPLLIQNADSSLGSE